MGDDESNRWVGHCTIFVQRFQFQTRFAATSSFPSARIQTDFGSTLARGHGMDMDVCKENGGDERRILVSQVNIKPNHTHDLLSFFVSYFVVIACKHFAV